MSYILALMGWVFGGLGCDLSYTYYICRAGGVFGGTGVVVLATSWAPIVRFENGGSLNIVRIGNGISYIGFNRTRYEDNQQGVVFLGIMLNIYTNSHNLIIQDIS